MSNVRNPVEKVVETLFFALTLHANVGKSFFYAPLAGVPETYFGDALVLTEKVFAFEFKRGLVDIAPELGKYNDVKNEADFKQKLNLQLPKASERECLNACSQRGHALVALAMSRDEKLIQVDPLNIQNTLLMAPYVQRLSNKGTDCHDSKVVESLVSFGRDHGMAVDEAKWYFEQLAACKKKGTRGGVDIDDDLIVGYFVDEKSAITVASAQTYAIFLDLIDQAQHNNESIEKNRLIDSASGPKP